MTLIFSKFPAVYSKRNIYYCCTSLSVSVRTMYKWSDIIVSQTSSRCISDYNLHTVYHGYTSSALTEYCMKNEAIWVFHNYVVIHQCADLEPEVGSEGRSLRREEEVVIFKHSPASTYTATRAAIRCASVCVCVYGVCVRVCVVFRTRVFLVVTSKVTRSLARLVHRPLKTIR